MTVSSVIEDIIRHKRRKLYKVLSLQQQRRRTRRTRLRRSADCHVNDRPKNNKSRKLDTEWCRMQHRKLKTFSRTAEINFENPTSKFLYRTKVSNTSRSENWNVSPECGLQCQPKFNVNVTTATPAKLSETSRSVGWHNGARKKGKESKTWTAGSNSRDCQADRGRCTTGLYTTHVFMQVVERVPHGRHDLGHFAEAGAGMLTFDCRLSVAEKQRVRRHRPATQHTGDRDFSKSANKWSENFDERPHRPRTCYSRGGRVHSEASLSP